MAAANTPPPFEVLGQNTAALFTLKAYRGEGMALLEAKALDWMGFKAAQ